MISETNEILLEGMIAIRNLLEGRITVGPLSQAERVRTAQAIAEAMHNIEDGNPVRTAVSRHALIRLQQENHRIRKLLPLAIAWANSTMTA